MTLIKTSSSQVREIPLRDFFKNPEKTDFEISPDGEYLAYLAPYENRLNIFVQKIGEDKSKRITSYTDRDLSGFFWKGNNHIIYTRDNKGDENYHLYSVNKSGDKTIDLTPFEKVTTQIIDRLEDSDEEIIIGLNKRNPEIFDVYRINVDNGEMQLAAENPGNFISWETDHEGKIRIAITSDGVNTSLLYRDDESQPFRTILTTTFKENIAPLFFTFDNKYVYASSNLNRDKRAIVKYNIANNKELEVIFEHPDVDVSHLSYSRKRKVLTTVTYITWKAEKYFFDEEIKNIYDSLEKKLGGYEISLVSRNKNEDKFIVRTHSDRSLGAYYLYEKEGDKLTLLSYVSPWLKEDEMCETKPITYKSRDGLTIYGYLTLPKNKESKNLPVVVHPHGGPWARDVWGYSPTVQFLANRGYAVFQMNFRGSIGFGRKFWEISFKQWGKTMQDDITDGVKWLIDQGITDPKRVAIFGGSYGGYATLAGLTFTPDLYACGVDYVGVSNLFTFLNTIPPYWKPYLEMMYEMVGNPEKDKELLTECSPVFHADKIKVPLLIAQGRMDPRVNVNESDQMVEALKKRGIEVPYMVKDNEGHGFHNEENQFDFYEVMEKFLEQHLKN